MYQELERQEKAALYEMEKELEEACKRGPILKILPEWIYRKLNFEKRYQEIEDYFKETGIPFTEASMLEVISGSDEKKDVGEALTALKKVGTEV